jgi:hypothetical protein
VIKAVVDDAAIALNVYLSFIVMPNLGRKLATLSWKMTDPNDLATGLHPFAAEPPDGQTDSYSRPQQ